MKDNEKSKIMSRSSQMLMDNRRDMRMNKKRNIFRIFHLLTSSKNVKQERCFVNQTHLSKMNSLAFKKELSSRPSYNILNRKEKIVI